MTTQTKPSAGALRAAEAYMTGQKCSCEGTGWIIDFALIQSFSRERNGNKTPSQDALLTQNPAAIL